MQASEHPLWWPKPPHIRCPDYGVKLTYSQQLTTDRDAITAFLRGDTDADTDAETVHRTAAYQ